MNNEIILDVKKLTTKLKLGNGEYPVVDELSFSLKKGETLALVGESGCGKSMTALSLMRILPTPPALHPTGEVLYKGQNLLEFSEKKMRSIRGFCISMIFQDPMSALNPVYSIGSQLIEVANIHLRLYGEEAFEKAVRVLEEVRIPEPRMRMDAFPHQLSGGMKQRVMIAMALMCEPDVLIADEPTTALDVTIQAQILKLMRNLQEERGMAILLITHDMGVVSEIADEIVVMYATQAVERGKASDLLQNISHPYTRGLFKSLPNNHQKGERLHVIEGSVPPITKLPKGCHFHNRCPKAMDICKEGEVPNFEVNEGKQKVKCWLYK